MTDLWKFSENPLSGGGVLEEGAVEMDEANMDEAKMDEAKMDEAKMGGLSVPDFLCRKRPEGDSKLFPFFADLTVPFGLVYLPPCVDSEKGEEEESDETKGECENFDRLFSLSSSTLGKKEGNRRTRKKNRDQTK